MSHSTLDGASTAGHPAISPVWQAWIAENVLLGSSARTIAEQMVRDGGFTTEVAEREVMAAIEHPYLSAAAKLGIDANTIRAAATGGSARADKYAWWLEVQRRTSKLSSTHGTVPRVTKPSRAEFLDAFYAPNLPCLIEGAMEDWPALTKWTPEYLKAACGDQTVEVQANRTAEDANALNVNRTMPFGEFVDIVNRGEQTDDWYMTANNDPGNRGALAGLWDDVRLPEYLAEERGAIGEAYIWYGPGGTLSATHHDLTNNLMAQVIGRKRVMIVAPNESAHMYNDHGRNSAVNLEQPDYDLHPALRDVTILEAEIGPGDLLFLPVGWWHSVRALDVSFTYTFTNFAYDDNDFFSFFNSDKYLGAS